MKSVLARLALFAASFASTGAVEFSVATCAELVDVDETVVTTLTITETPFECSAYTRFVVRNAMELKATHDEVLFSNLALKVKGSLTVEPDVIFTGVEEQVKNGGVLSIVEGSDVTFMRKAHFTQNSILIKYLEPVPCGENCFRSGRGLSYVTKKGGAIHNKGSLVFEDDAMFIRNEARTDDSTDVARGGAIWNTGSGAIHFKGMLYMEDNDADGFFEGNGGAIYNRGDIIVDGDATFLLNSSSDGGAIFQEPWGSCIFNGFTNFTQNNAFESRGGAVANAGGTLDFNAGSIFDDNGASCSGECSKSQVSFVPLHDGGMSPRLSVRSRRGELSVPPCRIPPNSRFLGSTTFSRNGAWTGGALNQADDPFGDNGRSKTSVISYLDGTVFEDNVAEECPNFYNGESICL